MEEFELGKVSYIMTLVWTVIMWEVFAIGFVGLIFEVSSLFSNAISVLSLPIFPILAVIFFHDKIGGIKVISMVLSIWGFVSYVYQQYLDDLKSKQHEDRNANEASNASSLQEFKKLKKQTNLVISVPPTNQQSLNPEPLCSGKSKWTATLLQVAGFPIIIPYYYISPPEKPTTNNIHRNEPSTLILAFICVSLGVLQAANSMMYSVGLLRLPVSTFALICASPLTFNAFFSFLINSQKFTPFIINSLVLLTVSSALLVFQTNSMNPTGNSNVNYEIGLFCTVGASAGFRLMLSVTELSFHKISRREIFTVILEMIIYQSLVATCATLVGLFASGEWKGLKREMDKFELGKFIFVSTLIWTAIAWQIFNIGAVGWIHEVSSLFSNVISVLGLPVIPVLAVIFFHDKMDGVKVISMGLAIWGFISYFYQHYLDDSESKAEKRCQGRNFNESPVERGKPHAIVSPHEV
uniref:Probable purine permease n=1 Tax=Quercus lobata TaxID=97700 RepID=A0A7N2LQR0_QUELO